MLYTEDNLIYFLFKALNSDVSVQIKVMYRWLARTLTHAAIRKPICFINEETVRDLHPYGMALMKTAQFVTTELHAPG